jgi:hypothetical protein
MSQLHLVTPVDERVLDLPRLEVQEFPVHRVGVIGRRRSRLARLRRPGLLQRRTPALPLRQVPLVEHEAVDAQPGQLLQTREHHVAERARDVEIRAALPNDRITVAPLADPVRMQCGQSRLGHVPVVPDDPEASIMGIVDHLLPDGGRPGILSTGLHMPRERARPERLESSGGLRELRFPSPHPEREARRPLDAVQSEPRGQRPWGQRAARVTASRQCSLRVTAYSPVRTVPPPAAVSEPQRVSR